MKVLVGVLLLAAFACAKPMFDGSPTACQTPKQFVGNYGVYTHTNDGTNANKGMMYYDATNQRIRVDVVLKGISYKVVQNYTEKLQYVMFNVGGVEKCIVQPWTKPFQPIVVPSDALGLERGRVGTTAHGLDVWRYYGEKDGATYVVTVTAADCVITDSIAVIPEKSQVYFSLTNVSRLKVTDADYAHPSDCTKAQGEEHEATRFARSINPF